MVPLCRHSEVRQPISSMMTTTMRDDHMPLPTMPSTDRREKPRCSASDPKANRPTISGRIIVTPRDRLTPIAATKRAKQRSSSISCLQNAFNVYYRSLIRGMQAAQCYLFPAADACNDIMS